jgi:hypothetical protein
MISMKQLLQEQGHILLYVPAGPWAFGALDTALGHYRRYTKKRLRILAKEVGLQLVACRYINAPGSLGWCWSSRIRKQTTILPAQAQLVDRVVPYLSAFERIFPPLFGQSLFAVFSQKS